MARDKQSNARASHVIPEEEFDESDILWSDYKESSDVSTVAVPPSPRGGSFTAGISAALLGDEEPRSPTSIQRKMTSSPVSLISSSYLAGNLDSNKNASGLGLGLGFGSRFHMSAPVNVPLWPNNNRPKFGDSIGNKDDEDEDVGKMIPPHEIVARSKRNSNAFSVIEGASRTLKGRDLAKVRNAVFRQTGFLD